MASEIKVDNIKDQCGTAVITKCGATHTVTAEVYKADTIQDTSGNAYLAKCGSTVTLGGCGQTIELASGASQTGFGRTGTVDWDTTPKTASFTGVSGNGYFVNTTSGAITVTLPASPNANDIVAIADYAGTADTNNITIGRNGSNINGSAADITISKNNSAITLVYVDGTQGWKATDTSSLNDIEIQPEYIVACGGTITCCGDYKIHTFTSPGTFTVSCAGNPAGSNVLEYLVVAGGGAGGTNGGGGGGGGFRFAAPSLSPLTYPGKPIAAPAGLTASAQAYPITVGAGASGGPYPISASRGSNSVFSSITSTGGGGGHGVSAAASSASGGSGGGGSYPVYPSTISGGAGNTPPVSPPQGRNGGNGGSPESGGGGGGAIDVGNNAPGPAGGPGGTGAGMPTGFGSNGQPSGSFRYYSGGGGGARQSPSPGERGTGGLGGGGISSILESTAGSGTANTGGGGGGSAGGSGISGGGGSGIVVIRYKFQ